MKITAAVAEAVGSPLTIKELELDELRPDEVRVRLVATGVCHTDAVVRDGWIPTTFPIVLGHEGAGVVEAVGATVHDLAPGDHVVLTVASCGTCRSCRSGHPSYCLDSYGQNFAGGRGFGTDTSLTDADGHSVNSHFFGQSSFSTHVNAARRSVVKVRDDVPLELLGPLGCGVQTGAGAVLNVLKPGPGDSIVVFGTGAVGMSALLAAVAARATTIIAVDLNPDRLALALELGATHAIDAGKEDALERIREITGGGSPVRARHDGEREGGSPRWSTRSPRQVTRARSAPRHRARSARSTSPRRSVAGGDDLLHPRGRLRPAPVHPRAHRAVAGRGASRSTGS